MSHRQRRRRAEFHAIVAVGHPVQAVRARRVEAKHLRGESAVDRVGRRRERTASERAEIHQLEAIEHARHVALEHLDIRHHVVRERDRLSALQVRVPGHHRLEVFLGDRDERLDQLAQHAADLIYALAQIHAQIDRDLIVARARGVQLFARRTEALCQLLFDEHMNVFRLGIDRQLALVDVVEYCGKFACDLLCVIGGNDPLPAQHRDVRDAAGDVLTVHRAVERHRTVEVVDPRVELFGEPALPEFCHYLLSFCLCFIIA